jgi:DNA-binding response OmpR family regulator
MAGYLFAEICKIGAALLLPRLDPPKSGRLLAKMDVNNHPIRLVREHSSLNGFGSKRLRMRSDPKATGYILVVEDEEIIQQLLVDTLSNEGYQTRTAFSAEGAWAQLEAEPDIFDVVLLDRLLPGGDGIEILRRIKGHQALTSIPVIMQTAMTSSEAIREGLDAGAHYYLTKPFEASTLLAIVRSAISDLHNRRALEADAARASRTLANLIDARFSFRTPLEAREIATLLANACPEPQRAVLGLTELMLNAIEHGNLEISYEEKSHFIASERLQEAIHSRLEMDEYKDRHATVDFSRTDGGISFTITDMGHGFDWEPFLEMRPERAFDTHGRGIAIARMMSFDRLEYKGSGNELTALIRQ